VCVYIHTHIYNSSDCAVTLARRRMLTYADVC
jgi:hypothetical protein